MDNGNKAELQRSDNLPQREDHVVGNSRSDNPVEQRVDNPIAENTPQRPDKSVSSDYNEKFNPPTSPPQFSVTLGSDQSAYTNKNKKKKRRSDPYFTIFIICMAIALISSTLLIFSGISIYNSRNHDLTYDANGGEGAPSAQTGNTYYMISWEEPSLSDCQFLGWSKDSEACCASYNPGEDIDLSSDTTLYAVWAMNGDINKNNTVDEYDLKELEYYLYGGLIFNDEEYKIADFNSDGWVDELDLKEMKAYLNLSEPTVDEVFSEDLYQVIDNIVSQNQ